MGRGNKQSIGHRTCGAVIATAFTLGLFGCGGPLSAIKNPFSEEEERLPGERIAVITDPGQFNAAQVAPQPVSLPPAKVNAAWTQPGGSPSKGNSKCMLSMKSSPPGPRGR